MAFRNRSPALLEKGLGGVVDGDRSLLVDPVDAGQILQGEEDGVDRAVAAGERRLAHRFRIGRVRVAGAGEVLGRRAEFHRDADLVDQVARHRPDDMRAEDAVGVLVGQHLDETLALEDGLGAAIAHDRAEKELNFAASVYDNSLEAIMITDADDRIVRVNPAFSDITGYGEQEIVGRHVATLRSDRHEPEFYQAISNSLQESGLWQGEVWSRRKNGDVYPQQMNISVSREKIGRASCRERV